MFLPHLLILEGIYYYESSLLYHPGAVHKISSQSVWKKIKRFWNCSLYCEYAATQLADIVSLRLKNLSPSPQSQSATFVAA